MPRLFNPPSFRKRLRLVVNKPADAGRLPAVPHAASHEWDQLTHAIVMDRARSGTLDPAIVEALLAGVGLRT